MEAWSVVGVACVLADTSRSTAAWRVLEVEVCLDLAASGHVSGSFILEFLRNKFCRLE